MTIITVRAKYENGRFVLKTPLDLANGTVVEITEIRLVSQQETDSDENA